MEKKLKTIKVKESTHRRLCECGRKGETFDEIINRLIDKAKEGQA